MKTRVGAEPVYATMLTDAYVSNLPIEHLATTIHKTPPRVQDPTSAESQQRIAAAAAKRARRALKARNHKGSVGGMSGS